MPPKKRNKAYTKKGKGKSKGVPRAPAASASAPAAANDGEQPQMKMWLSVTEDEVTEDEVTKAAAAAGGIKARTGAKSTAAWERDVKDDEAAAA